MIAYLATKRQFLTDAVDIEDRVRAAVHDRLGLNVGSRSSEYQSWRNSLGNAMFHVLNTSDIDDTAGIAVEYRITGRSKRIDLMVSGFDGAGDQSIALVELKQWTDVSESPLPEHVQTWLGGREVTTVHPAYQAWSYSSLLEDFYEVVTADPIRIRPCAFAHNCDNVAVLRSERDRDLLSRAPVFLKGDHTAVRDFIGGAVRRGDSGSALRRLDESAITPSRQLIDALDSMLDGNDEFVLIDEQKTAFESIMQFVDEARAGVRHALIVEGGPGTGKSVIAVNALVRLLGRGLNTRYVTKNGAPRAVYRSKLQGASPRANVANLFVSSDAFVHSDPMSFDVLLVDEAHRLVRKSGIYQNLGDHQVAEIMRASRISVYFLDESQRVTWRDVGTFDEISNCALDAGIPVTALELATQFRCAGSDEYLGWVDSVLSSSDHPPVSLADSEYDVRIVDSPTDLRDEILLLNARGGTSRLLAGYCWDWISKKDPQALDITFPDDGFAMRWNLTKDGQAWMIAENSVNEVGCIHTCQGLEGDYMGVIIGNDLVYRDGEVRTDPAARARTDSSLRGWKSAMKTEPVATAERVDRLIRNTYRTLLTRGMRGTLIYCTDASLRAYLNDSIEVARRRSRIHVPAT